MNILHIDGTSEQRRDLVRGEACNAAADARDQEGQLGMLLGEDDELLHVGKDGTHTALHRRDGIALSLQANALSHDGPKPFKSDTGCTATMHALQVAAEDKDFVSVESPNVVWRDAMAELAHFTIVAVLAIQTRTE